MYTENEPVNEISAHQFLKISVSIHTDFQKLAYTEKKTVYTEKNQCTPVFEISVSVHTDFQKLVYTEKKTVSTEN